MVNEFHPETEADGRSSFEVEAETRRKCSRSCWRGWAASSPKSKSKPNLSSRLSQTKRQVIYMPVAELSNVMGPEQPCQKRRNKRDKATPKCHGPSRNASKAKKPPLPIAKMHQFLIMYREVNNFTLEPRHTLTSYHAMPWLGLHCVYGCNFFEKSRDFGTVLQLSWTVSNCVPYQPLILAAGPLA